MIDAIPPSPPTPSPDRRRVALGLRSAVLVRVRLPCVYDAETRYHIAIRAAIGSIPRLRSVDRPPAGANHSTSDQSGDARHPPGKSGRCLPYLRAAAKIVSRPGTVQGGRRRAGIAGWTVHAAAVREDSESQQDRRHLGRRR